MTAMDAHDPWRDLRLDEALFRGKLSPRAALDGFTWLRVGGEADLLFQPLDSDDLVAFLKHVPKTMPVSVIGVGSNLLVRDGGVAGAVVRLSARGFGKVERIGETRLKVGAAALDRHVASAAHEAGLGGFHFYHGIPGSIGGALRMNAGANGVETMERVVEVHALDRTGARHILTRAEMGYAYRMSSAPEDLIFTHAILEGYPQDKAEIRAAMDAVQKHRESVQPIREKTGGSTFKNPPGASAWQVIDAAGCRGLMIGGAQMSPLHCNFMINTGTASAHDLECLGETVRLKVLEHSGIVLEWEIRRIGVFREGQAIAPFLGKGP